MNNAPYPITGESLEEVVTKVNSLITSLYEDTIGGANLGDVFSVPGDVLTLVTDDDSPITKVDNKLGIATDGVTIQTASNVLETIGSSTDFTVVTAIQAGGAGALGFQYKTRLLTLTKGLITEAGTETDWIDI
jgi:hypothetical protein